MVIKSKGWTALPAVKITSFALLILLAFAFCGNVFIMAEQLDNSAGLDIVFANLSGNDVYYRRYMNSALMDLQDLLFFESEENIKAGNCLKWVEHKNGESWLESSGGSSSWSGSSWSGSIQTAYIVDAAPGTGSYMIEDDSGEFSISWNEAADEAIEQDEQLTEEQIRLQRESLEKDAINNQLQVFRNLQKRLQNQPGLRYYISKPGFGLSNSSDNSMDFFMGQPVFSIIENGLSIAQSNDYYIPTVSGNYTIYIGYTAESIRAQTAHWQSIQKTVMVQIAATIIIVVLAAVTFITLLCGAGRKRFDDAVYFNVLDKPYLDIGFGLLVIYEGIIVSVISSLASGYGGYILGLDSVTLRRVMVLFAVAVAFMLPPLLLYITSFAKRFKAGKWWRYTLIWRIWTAIWSRCVSFAKSLWAGVPLTLKALLAAFVLFCAMVITAAISGMDAFVIIPSFFVAAVAALLMLRFAHNLRRLETGAKAAAEGRYGKIYIKNGELGKIAEHINNISAGMESAVDERLKSERLKTELITNVSHDIRTPITSLITYTDLLKNEGLASENAPGYLDVLIQKSQRLKTLTDELFEAAKASTGNIETNLETLDLAALTRQVLGELDERIQASGLDFRLNLPEHMWVTADGKLLWRIAENLLSNVFKYSLPQSRVYIDLANEGSEARLDIKNISVNPLNVAASELTERFKRGDDSRSSEGSGLGLSIAQSFVEAQKGRFKLTVDGDLFKASVYLPAAMPPTD